MIGKQGERPVIIVPYTRVQLDYDGSGNVIYVGIAGPGSVTSDSVWAIRKFTYSGGGNLLNTAWANGLRDFINVWDNRTSLTYS